MDSEGNAAMTCSTAAVSEPKKKAAQAGQNACAAGCFALRAYFFLPVTSFFTAVRRFARRAWRFFAPGKWSERFRGPNPFWTISFSSWPLFPLPSATPFGYGEKLTVSLIKNSAYAI
jgi:hypothetical protein